jgi:hypothetical protein
MREYELTIRGTGEVSFRGKFGNRQLGNPERWEVSRADIARLVEAFDRAGFFQLGDEYGRDPNTVGTDEAFSLTGIVIGGRSKTVSRQVRDERKFTPEERTLRGLELTIIGVAGAEARIREACALEDTSGIP